MVEGSVLSSGLSDGYWEHAKVFVGHPGSTSLVHRRTQRPRRYVNGGNHEFDSEVCLLDWFAGLAVPHAAGFAAGGYDLHLHRNSFYHLLCVVYVQRDDSLPVHYVRHDLVGCAIG